MQLGVAKCEQGPVFASTINRVYVEVVAVFELAFCGKGHTSDWMPQGQQKEKKVGHDEMCILPLVTM